MISSGIVCVILLAVVVLESCPPVVNSWTLSRTTAHLRRQRRRPKQGMMSRPTTQSLSASTSSNEDLFVGFDLGTSGARISVIDCKYEEVYTKALSWQEASSYSSCSYDDPDAWKDAVFTLLDTAKVHVDLSDVKSLCFSGTSASCLLLDSSSSSQTVSRSPRMYNYDVTSDDTAGTIAMKQLTKYAPAKHTALSPTGSLAKLLSWHAQAPIQPTEQLCHQADYLAYTFLGDSSLVGIVSDWHNCLKLGYDVRALNWPTWLTKCLADNSIPQSVLPQTIVSPGQRIGPISQTIAEQTGLSANQCVVVAGTTDSNAAFFAATGKDATLGTAVTSLGSTLAIKQLSSQYVEDASVGVYSHRFPSVLLQDTGKDKEAWLVGGASNVGCAVLRSEGFSNEELEQLSRDIDPTVETPLDYYPLIKKGERFPVSDSSKEPVLTPKPDNRKDYLHGILQGISTVECDGFNVLGKLGASPMPPTVVMTSGGGSRNDMWIQMRQRRLQEAFGSDIQVAKAQNVEAGYGAAILAASTFR